MENTKHHRLTSFAETASEAPLQEPDRQYYFIEKAKESNNKTHLFYLLFRKNTPLEFDPGAVK